MTQYVMHVNLYVDHHNPI